VIRKLSKSRAASGTNSARDIDTAAAAYKESGLSFSGARMASHLSTDCSRIDADAVGAVLGTELVHDPHTYPLLGVTPGYPMCLFLAKRDPKVLMFAVYLSPDLDGDANWANIGTLEGAQSIADVGDSAVWSDGSRSPTNQSNALQLQLQVTEAGAQSLIQASTSEYQLRHIRSWTVPRLLLALAEINADMSR
jgi:hypothetical protein